MKDKTSLKKWDSIKSKENGPKITTLPSRKDTMNKTIDQLTTTLFKVASSMVILILFGIFAFLIKESFPAYEELNLRDFLFSLNWNPDGWEGEFFGILSLLVGTFFVAVVTMIISVPIGLLVAVYLSEFASDTAKLIIKPLIELMAGIPSVVIGFFGIVLVGPFLSKLFGVPNGLNALNGSLLLSFMILPTIISLSEDAISAVPNDFRHASTAMGANQIETIINVILPAAKSGIIASIMLGFGRAVGETMTVLMACGNAPALPQSIFDSVRTLTATIAIEMGEVAYDTTHYYSLFNLGLFLFIISFAINMLAHSFIKKGAQPC
jgi:phosphate transport system permease protein